MNISLRAVLGAVLFLLAARSVQAADPRDWGPHLVGVRTEIWVDHDRTCPVTGKPRTLVTEIWYPAAPSAHSLPVNRFEQFWGNPLGRLAGAVAIRAFGGKYAEICENFRNVARRNAEPAEGVFPVLLFSHGNGGFRHQNVFQMEYLASHGYLVAACDHTGNAAVTVLPESPVLYQPRTIKDLTLWDHRPRDLSFLLSKLEQLNKQKDHWLYHKIDNTTVGALGHSFGGFTVCRLAEMDRRVDAILPMTVAGTLHDVKDLADRAEASGRKLPDDVPNVACRVPLLVILADHDRTVGQRGNDRSRAFFDRAEGPRYLLVFKDAGHFTFTEMRQINPNYGDGIGSDPAKDGEPGFAYSDAAEAQRITNQYSVAFFDTFLRGDESARRFLDRNQYPNQIVYERVIPAAIRSK